MNVIIREAEKADCPRILELVRGLALYERAPLEVTVTIEEFEEAGFGLTPVWKSFVAEVSGKVEGFALYYIRFSTWKGCRMYLEDFYVNDTLRGKGIGSLLFEQILLEAKEKKFNGISWQVLGWNQPAIDFYTKYKAHFDNEWVNVSLCKEQLSMKRYNT